MFGPYLTIGTYQLSMEAIAYAENRPGGNLLVTLQANRCGVFSRAIPSGNLLPPSFELTGNEAESVRSQLSSDQFTPIGNYLVNQDVIIGIEPEHVHSPTQTDFRYYLDCEACPGLTFVSATGTEARDLRARNLWMQRDGLITGGTATATATGTGSNRRQPVQKETVTALGETPAKPKRTLSAAGRKRIQAAMKKRWAEKKLASKAKTATAAG